MCQKAYLILFPDNFVKIPLLVLVEALAYENVDKYKNIRNILFQFCIPFHSLFIYIDITLACNIVFNFWESCSNFK